MNKIRTSKDYLVIYAKGIAMGAADIVPGVSGGTIALMTGIYEELIQSIANCNPNTLKMLRQQGIKTTWQHINGSFLFALMMGILTAVISLAKVIKTLLDTQPLYIWSFFFGLVLATIFVLYKKIPTWTGNKIIASIIGFLLALIVVLSPTLSPQHIGLGYIFTCGIIAICAMILPGISGSFILVLMGAYGFILDAIHHLNIGVISIFGIGAIVGLLTFANILKWLFAHYHELTLALLTGFITGSLAKLWPWNNAIQHMSFLNAYLLPLIFIATGMIAVYAIEHTGKR